MRRDELDVRVRDNIVEYISNYYVTDGGYCGDQRYDMAKGLLRHLRSNGYDLVTLGEDVTTPDEEQRIFLDLMSRFRRPKYQDHITYHRNFAYRIIDAIYDAGMEIRT